MTPPPCPQCQQFDQVQSVPALYATQVRTVPSIQYRSTIDPSTGAATMTPMPSTSTVVTPLGRQLAPPSALSAGAHLGLGCLILVTVFAVMGILAMLVSLTTDQMSRENPAPLIVGLIFAIGVPVAGFWIFRVRQRRPSPYRAFYQASRDLWLSAFICMRCFGAFFNEGALPPQLAWNGLIPVPQFTTAIADLGRRLAYLDPARYPQSR